MPPATTISPPTTPKTRQNRYADSPAWARRTDKTIPPLHAPRLSQVAPGILEGLRPLGLLLVARPIIGLAIFIGAALAGWWPIAIASVWLVYGGALTAIHHLIHGSLGFSARARRTWLTVLGCIVVESGHALQTTHVMHHREDPSLPDPEGYIEMSSWKTLPIDALKYRYRLALWGLRYSPRRRRIQAEMAFHAVVHMTSLALLPVFPLLWIYLTLIHVATVLFAALQSKGPQMNWGRAIPSPLVRVTAHGVVAAMMFSHQNHLEHHAFPKVPMPRLPQLKPVLDTMLEGRTDVTEVRLAA